MIVQSIDFQQGFYRIPTTQYTQGELVSAINKYEPIYLAYLLGVELSELFIADLDGNGVPQTQRFIDIYEEFIKEIHCKIENSIGIKKMLIGFIYYEVMINRNYVPTEGGNVASLKENANLLSYHNNSRVAEIRFNESKFSADSIQRYICDNIETYPEYEGKKIEIQFNALI